MKLTFLSILALVAVSFSGFAEETPAAKLTVPKPKQTKVEFSDIGEVEFEPADKDLTIRYTLDGSAPTVKSYAYCVPVRAAKSLKLKAASFDKDGKSSDPVEVEFVQQTAEKTAAPAPLTVAINLDFSEAPELKDWALQARKYSEEYYAKIQELMPIEGYTPPRQVMFKWKDMPGVAYTTGTSCTFAVKFYKANPKDFGSVIHELTHVYQQYRGKNPGWMVEGIADYVRWQNWEPVEKRRKFNPKTAKLANAYNDAACFLVYLQNTYDKELVKKLNEAAHKGTYTDEMIKSICKNDVPALWDEFIASFNKPATDTKTTTESKPTETKAVAEKTPDVKASETK